MDGHIWSVAEAKARFSEVLEHARTDGPQHVTRHGRAAVVIVAAAEWERRLRSARTLTDVLLDPAVRGVREPGEQGVFERDHADDPAKPHL